MKKQTHGQELTGESTIKIKNLVRGECIVALHEKDLAELPSLEGKILVTTMTTPDFMPYINGVKGIITDNGGIICHAAIISREYGIPCIIGTEASTQMLGTGDMVEMDMQSGIVRKM
jgi:pyruvate,water dikinase